MAFELKPTHYYLGVWRARLTDNAGDIMAMIWKDEADGLWYLKIRFRYYHDDKFFESKDERSWSQYKSKTGDDSEGERMKAIMKAILNNLLDIGGEGGAITDLTFVPCNGNGDAMAKIMTNPERPGTQWAIMTSEQEREYLNTNKLPAGVEPKGDV